MRISDWSSDVCSSDLDRVEIDAIAGQRAEEGVGAVEAAPHQTLTGEGRGALGEPEREIPHLRQQVPADPEPLSDVAPDLGDADAQVDLRRRQHPQPSEERKSVV